MRDDGPGHGRGIDTTNHPEHAKPAQVLSSFLLGQEFRVVGKHNRDGTANAMEQKKKKIRTDGRLKEGEEQRKIKSP